MSRLILYHGSLEIVQNPQIDKGKTYNDYGRGFYCTEHLELAREWGSNEGVDGYTNQYEIETDHLNILNLSSPEYTVLHWLALLMDNRKVRTSAPVVKRGKEWLKEHYLIDISPYDAMIIRLSTGAGGSLPIISGIQESRSEISFRVYLQEILSGYI